MYIHCTCIYTAHVYTLYMYIHMYTVHVHVYTLYMYIQCSGNLTNLVRLGLVQRHQSNLCLCWQITHKPYQHTYANS